MSHLNFPQPKIPQKLTIPSLFQRRFRHRSKHLPTLALRRHLPPFRDVHVRRAGRQLGRHAPRLRGAGPSAYPRCILEVWGEDSDQE